MQTSETVLSLICGLGVLQGILLASLVYFHPRADRSVNKFLSLFILFLSFIMAIPFMLNFAWQYAYLYMPTPLLIGPLIYLYLRSFKEVITLRKALPHFIVFVVYFPIIYWSVRDLLQQFPDAKTVPPAAFGDPVVLVVSYVRLGQSVLYYFLARKTLRSYQRSIHQLYSETDHIDLNWCKLLVTGYLVVILSALCCFSLMVRFPDNFNLFLLIAMSIATPYIYIITYKGITQPTLWQLKPGTTREEFELQMQDAEAVETVQSDEKQKYLKTGLTGNKLDEIVSGITGAMENDKVYRDTELTLQQLAEKLEYSPHQVSQAINEGLRKNFYDLVNGYRVEEAKRLLLDPRSRQYTILSIGQDAGFNSKTTFNTVFKKFTGKTPTSFRDGSVVETHTA